MREVKFQVWDAEFQKMFSWEELLEMKIELGSFFSNEQVIRRQYTGEKDVYGAEIYDGHIIIREIVSPSTINEDFIGEVKFYEGRWWIDNGRDAIPLWLEMGELKIIGNVYQNRELLEVK